MSEHIDMERLHDLVDGLVPAAGVERARAHMDTCPECRAAYARLSEVVAAVRALPADARTPEGVWAGIEARIAGTLPEARAAGADVVPLPGGEARRRRISLTWPQLAAAAVVVSLASAGTVWMALGGGSVAPAPAVAGAPLVPGDGPAARAVASGDVEYEAAVLELRALVDRGRDVLAPETVATLERSLAFIDEAIGEVRRALDQDPGSPILARILVNHQRSKLRVLRQAAIAAQARS